MSTLSRAVFLSYASEDAEAAQRIAEALRAAGSEVWFDKSELRGGDAWDRAIRTQIHDCALFIPIISAHSDARHEGYFRREWRLAIERAGDMSERVAFLVPVVIDDTSESRADVPDRFRTVQWTRLPDGETTPGFVERVRRLLSPEMPSAPDAARSGSSAVASGAPAAPRLIRRRMGVLSAMIVAAMLLALGYVGFERMNRSKLSVPGMASIAVLPLANESGDPTQLYFSDGISEDLITALSQFPGLKVIGRTSAFQFRDAKEDSRTIGAKLGVAHLLEGTVRRAGEMVRVTAELIDTADGSTQWSERYDRPYKDLFALQDEITHAVAGALRAKLVPGEHAEALSERPPSGSLEAYNAMLQGRFYEARRTEADIRAAIEHYTIATRLDPHYAFAWSSISLAWNALGTTFPDTVPMQPAFAEARTTAATALALAPGLAAAHLARGNVLNNADLDWRGAEEEFRRALELAPNDGAAKLYLASQLATLGQVEQAVELTRQALATDPLGANSYYFLAGYLQALHRLDEAERAVRKAIELQPRAAAYHAILAVIEVQRGDARGALTAAQQETEPGWQYIALAFAHQIGGDHPAADAALQTLIDQRAEFAAYQIAEVYAFRNDADNTFAWLDRAWSNRDSGIGFLLYDPFVLSYKDDPRFAAFCRKVGLPAPGEVRQRT
jgi:TolB-like protein/Flp pilus assembly protein TadD